MLVQLNTSESISINWGASGSEEIAQNVLSLISTMKYEVAYDRTLGLRRDFQDAPLPEAISLATSQIFAVIDEREPRATVVSVEFAGLDEGNLIFKVVIDI